jgi:hypothetical protein
MATNKITRCVGDGLRGGRSCAARWLRRYHKPTSFSHPYKRLVECYTWGMSPYDRLLKPPRLIFDRTTVHSASRPSS